VLFLGLFGVAHHRGAALLYKQEGGQVNLEVTLVCAVVAVGAWLFLDVLEIRKQEKEKQFEDMVCRARRYAYLEGKWPEEIDRVEATLRKEKEGMK